MSKLNLLLVVLLIVSQSCKKDVTPHPLVDDEVTFAGEYDIQTYSKMYSTFDFVDSYFREVSVEGSTGIDYRKTTEAPDSGGGAGETTEITYSVEVIENNFMISNDYNWVLNYNVKLTTEGETLTEIAHQELMQAGTFAIMPPVFGEEFDFRLRLNFESTDCSILKEYFDADGELYAEIELPPNHENSYSVRNFVDFNVVLEEGNLTMSYIDIGNLVEDYSNNTYLINEGQVSLLLQLK